jgi:O-antigen/teichoic acid export membrane protein
VLFPTFSHLQGQDNKQRESMAVMRSSWLLSMLAATILVPVIIWSQDFMRLWLGPLVAADTYRVLQVITLAGLLGSGTSVGIFYLMGIGKTNWSAVISILTGIVVLAGSLVLVPRLGLLGAGWGNVLSMLVRVAVVSAMWRVFFRTEMRWTVYVSAVYGPTIIGLSLGAGFLILKPHLHMTLGWFGLISSAGASAVIIALTIISVDNLLPGGQIRHNDVMRIAGGVAAGIGRPRAHWFKPDYS